MLQYDCPSEVKVANLVKVHEYSKRGSDDTMIGSGMGSEIETELYLSLTCGIPKVAAFWFKNSSLIETSDIP